jgi:hypothetical protein
LAENQSAFQFTVADPYTWLGAHQWNADIARPPELSAEYRRHLPPVLDPAEPDAPIFWLASATRGSRTGSHDSHTDALA